MSSKVTDASEQALITLIYRHLRDNGYKKAADVLRKNAPHQVETKEVRVSLSEIFNTWARKKKKQDKAENAKSPKKPVTKSSGSKKQTKKETVQAAADSDSDTSLDVEKWTKLVSYLSDADIAKMEVLSNLVKSPVASAGTSTKKRTKTKQTNPKKEVTTDKNVKSRAAAKKTKVKTDDNTVKTDTTKTSAKKSKNKSTADISKNPKTSSKKTGGKSKTSDLNIVETPAVDHQVHELETDKLSTPSDTDSQKIQSPEKVKDESLNGLSSESSSSKKTKRKKVERLSESTDIENPSEKTDNSLSDTKVVKKKKKKASEPEEAHSEDANLTSDQSETPSKKMKNKKSKGNVETVPSETPNQFKAKKAEDSADLETAFLQESSNTDSPSKKQLCLLEAEDSETPSKKSKKVKNFTFTEPDPVQTPYKTTKKHSSDLPQSDSTKEKKRKSKSNGLETQSDVHSETELMQSPIQSNTSRVKTSDDDDDGGGLGNEDLKTHFNKKKHKREEAEDVLAPEPTPEPKKAKKNKQKNREAEEVPEDLQEASEEAEVTVATSQKKKKKRKRQQESEETVVSDDLNVSAAVAEDVIIHKKKKKSSTQKHLNMDEASGFSVTDQEQS